MFNSYKHRESLDFKRKAESLIKDRHETGYSDWGPAQNPVLDQVSDALKAETKNEILKRDIANLKRAFSAGFLIMMSNWAMEQEAA